MKKFSFEFKLKECNGISIGKRANVYIADKYLCASNEIAMG